MESDLIVSSGKRKRKAKNQGKKLKPAKMTKVKPTVDEIVTTVRTLAVPSTISFAGPIRKTKQIGRKRLEQQAALSTPRQQPPSVITGPRSHFNVAGVADAVSGRRGGAGVIPLPTAHAVGMQSNKSPTHKGDIKYWNPLQTCALFLGVIVAVIAMLYSSGWLPATFGSLSLSSGSKPGLSIAPPPLKKTPTRALGSNFFEFASNMFRGETSLGTMEKSHGSNNEAEAKALQLKAKIEAEAERVRLVNAKAKADSDARAKSEIEAKAVAEAKAAAEIKIKAAEAEARLKAEIKARTDAQAQAQAQGQADPKAKFKKKSKEKAEIDATIKTKFEGKTNKAAEGAPTLQVSNTNSRINIRGHSSSTMTAQTPTSRNGAVGIADPESFLSPPSGSAAPSSFTFSDSRWAPGARLTFSDSGGSKGALAIFGSPLSHRHMTEKDVAGIWTGSRMISSRASKCRGIELTSPPLVVRNNPFAAVGHSLGLLDIFTGRGVSVVNRKFHVSRPPAFNDCYCMRQAHTSLSISLFASVNIHKLILFHRHDDFVAAPKRFHVLGWTNDPTVGGKVPKPKSLGSFELIPPVGWFASAANTNSGSSAPESSLPARHSATSMTVGAAGRAGSLELVGWEMQSFEIPQARRNATTGFRAITLQFLSNHGSKDKTCVYRLQVLGDVINSFKG